MIGQNTPEQPARTAKELWARARPDLDSGRCETWAEYTALSEDERVAYDRMLKRLWDYPSVLRETRRENLEEGESEEEVREMIGLTDEELAEARIKQ